MEQSVALLLVACSLLVGGCCATPHHATKWEYKEAVVPLPANADEQHKLWGPTMRERQEYLNTLGAEGWVLVSENEGVLNLKRATLLSRGTRRSAWEYKVTPAPRERVQYVDSLKAEGWALVSEDEGVLYMMRPRHE